MKTHKTIAQIVTFYRTANAYCESNKETKGFAAIKKIQQNQLKKIVEEFNDDLDNARLDCCAVDANGVILRDAEKNYTFTPAGIKKLKPIIKELGLKKFEISAIIVECLGFSEEEQEAFAGFILPDKKP